MSWDLIITYNEFDESGYERRGEMRQLILRDVPNYLPPGGHFSGGDVFHLEGIASFTTGPFHHRLHQGLDKPARTTLYGSTSGMRYLKPDEVEKLIAYGFEREEESGEH